MSTFKSTNRVKFIDEHMENFENESSALHRKLQSKNEALKIMRVELERFRTERDQFKIMAETIQMRYSAIKSSLENCENDFGFEGSSSTLGFLLNQSREKNIALQTETEALRQKLNELQGDIKLLRNKNVEMSKVLKTKPIRSEVEADEAIKAWHEEKSKLIDQLEGLKKKNAQLQFDFRSLLDEKEEIINERDVFKCKVHRLNHELNTALKGNGTIDIDALIIENKFLHEKIDNLQKELEYSKQSNDKLQTLMKAKRVKSTFKFGGNNNKEVIMSHKQVTKLLTDDSGSELKTASISDLKAVCLALLDNLNDKSIGLSHQKQTNRLLAAKVCSLEEKVRALSGDSSRSSLFTPSQLLLDNYATARVDEDSRISKQRRDVPSKNGESSESTKSMMSSEFETQSSEFSSELKQLNYIKIINDEDDFNDEENSMKHWISNEIEREETLSALPPDIQKLVDDAMKSSESLEANSKSVETYQCKNKEN